MTPEALYLLAGALTAAGAAAPLFAWVMNYMLKRLRKLIQIEHEPLKAQVESLQSQRKEDKHEVLETLGNILEQTKATNGRVAMHDRELREQRDYLVWLMGQAGQPLSASKGDKP